MIKIKLFIRKVIGLYKIWNNKNISRKSFIANNVQFLGIDNIEVGANSTIGESTTFTVNKRDDKKVRLKIGENTYIGRNNFFTVGKYLEVGPYCIFGNNCSFICSDHVFDSPLIPYALSGFTSGKTLKVGANCWIGMNVTVVGNVTIGHGSIIGANSVILKDIPPFSLIIGNPSKIIKRFDFQLKKWINVVDIDTNYDYVTEEEYIKILEKKYDNLPLSYYSSSSQFGSI